MSRILAVHSFRGGTGKSNTTANLAALLALDGRRVGVIDSDLQSPGIHVLFGLAGGAVGRSLNDYLWGRCGIAAAARDVTATLTAPTDGRLFLIPASVDAEQIVTVLRGGYDVGALTEGYRSVVGELDLDVLLIDTHPGLGEETLFSIAISNALAIVLRPDEQDYEGTGVTVEVARSLAVPRSVLVVNKVPAAFDAAAVQARIERAYGCEVAAVLPHSDEMMALASNGIFAVRYPDHPMTAAFKQVAARLMA